MKIEIENRKAEEYPSKDNSLCDTMEDFIESNTWVSYEVSLALIKKRLKKIMADEGIY